jgi:hypothetical protein
MSANTIFLLALALAGAALLIALALGAVVWRIRRLKRAVEVAKIWPTASGRVVGTQIDVRSFSRGISYGAIIAYEYDIAGVRHRSNRYSLSGPPYFSFQGRAKRLLARFPAGAEVTVSYDPAEPENGVIALQAPHIVTLRVIFWVFFVLIAWLVGGVLLFEPMFGPQPLIRL